MPLHFAARIAILEDHMTAFNPLGQIGEQNPMPTRDATNPLAVSIGMNDALKAISINGIRTNIPTASEGVVERVTSLLAPMAGIAMSIVSDNAADVGIIILVSAVGPNGVAMTPFQVLLKGTTPVAIGTLSRINRMARVNGDI
ncbi:MAG: hypothetical protein ACREJC_04750, partial [Tepidisphaeraceae bacterium]